MKIVNSVKKNWKPIAGIVVGAVTIVASAFTALHGKEDDYDDEDYVEAEVIDTDDEDSVPAEECTDEPE